MAARKFLVIGAGGREHALAWKLAQAADAPIVFVAPGNAGIAGDATIRGGCVDIPADDFASLAAFASAREVDLTIVGPEAPLCAGIVDYFQDHDLPIFGPGQQAAALEGSKSFAKEIMLAAGVPTAAHVTFDNLADALEYVENAPHPLVLKVDGLAGGKGVVISDDLATSQATLRRFLGDTTPAPGPQTAAVVGACAPVEGRVVIEEFLQGREVSFMVVTDGEHIAAFATSQDHKRVGEGDTGPNTGGMGAITPAPNVPADLADQVIAQVLQPTLAELRARGLAYCGFLYAGLMLCADGPRVLEFNCRMGDPECQALLFGLDPAVDLADVLLRAARGQLGHADNLDAGQPACCVVLAAPGYPDQVQAGQRIDGLSARDEDADTTVFFGGVRRDESGELLTHGGRVLSITARAPTPQLARQRAYDALAGIHWEGMHFRRDIGQPRAPDERPPDSDA